VEDDRVVACAGIDDVRAAGTVDGVVARAANNRVRTYRTDDRYTRGQRRRIDILEVGNSNGVARRLVDIAEIDSRDGTKGQRVDANPTVDRDF
jgi:hypothetical protein